MQAARLTVQSRFIALVVAAVSLVTPAAAVTLAEEVAPPVYGCSFAPARPVQAAVASEAAEGVEEEESKFVGSIPAPPGVDEDDEDALLPLAKISRDEAVQKASAVVPDLQRRRLLEAEIEIESGFVIWEVEFAYRRGERGPDRVIEVVVDAGNGQILLIECDDEED